MEQFRVDFDVQYWWKVWRHLPGFSSFVLLCTRGVPLKLFLPPDPIFHYGVSADMSPDPILNNFSYGFSYVPHSVNRAVNAKVNVLCSG